MELGDAICGGGDGLRAESLAPPSPPSPSCSPHRRKQGRYNLFSWLSMKVRGRGTRACVCLDLTPLSLPPTHPPPPPQLFISLGCLLTPVFLCLSPASFALLTHPGPLGGHTSSSFIRSVCSSYIISSHLPLMLFHTSFSFVSLLCFSRQVAAGSVAFCSDYYVNNYRCPPEDERSRESRAEGATAPNL